jgi:hypothetical protein
MHIHGQQMNLVALNPYAAAADIQRKADVRKKLMKSANEIEGLASSDETGMAGKMMNRWRGQSFTEDEYHAGNGGRTSDFG